MYIDGSVFCAELVFLTVWVCVKASTITVNKDNCGGNKTLYESEPFLLHYYGASLGEGNPQAHRSFPKECVFKISSSQSNKDICIRRKGRESSLYQLTKCSSVFKYYIGTNAYSSERSYTCKDFNVSPLCTSLDTVYAVFVHNNSIERLSVELEIYARKQLSKREIEEETWSSWTSQSDTDISDSTKKGVMWERFLIIVVAFIIIILLVWFSVLVCMKFDCDCDCEQPCITANTQETVTLALPDNPFIDEHHHGRHPRHCEHYQAGSSTEDPWKPPDYDSVMAIDQSFYGESKPCKFIAKNSGPGIEEDQDDSLPPYPGVF